ncbi:MAG: capsule biosynthesis protein, partial [Parvibaculaceae bacterium]
PAIPVEPAPAPVQKAPKKKRAAFLRRLLFADARLHLMVTLPTLLVASYYAFIASDLYSAESKFIIRGRQQLSMSSPLTQMLNMTGLTRAYDETFTVSDFVVSRDAMEDMNKELDLRQAFNRPDVDFLSSLWWGNSNEDLLTYYRNKVKVVFDSNTNISTLTTFAFTPEDAERMNLILLRLSETIVNRLNERAQRDSVKLAQDEVELAEERVKQARIAMTKFRKKEGTLDPAKGSMIVTEIIAKLEADLATTKAQITEVEALSQENNPRLLGLNNRVQALESQIEKERARLTGDNNDVYADQIERYEGLVIDNEFSNKRLVAATQSLELARVEAQRQNLYLVRIVEPAAPDDALYPKRILNTVTVFAVLLLLYWLSTLIWAAAKEHKN